MAIPVEDAACDALACYLRQQLADVRDLKVASEWIGNARTLPPRAITIITAGDRQDEFCDAEVMEMQVLSPTRALYTWRLKDISQPLQLDVWATSRAHRADLLARLEGPLNRGMSIVDPTATPIGPGLTLALGCGLGGYGDYVFDRPNRVDNADADQQHEFRAMYRGRVRCVVTYKFESPRLTRVQLAMALNGQLPATARLIP